MVEGIGNLIFWRSGIADVGGKWRDEGRGAGARPIPEEFAFHSKRIAGATRLAAKRVPEVVIKDEGRRSSDAFMVYKRGANMGGSSMGFRGARERGRGIRETAQARD